MKTSDVVTHLVLGRTRIINDTFTEVISIPNLFFSSRPCLLQVSFVVMPGIRASSLALQFTIQVQFILSGGNQSFLLAQFLQ